MSDNGCRSSGQTIICYHLFSDITFMHLYYTYLCRYVLAAGKTLEEIEASEVQFTALALALRAGLARLIAACSRHRAPCAMYTTRVQIKVATSNTYHSPEAALQGNCPKVLTRPWPPWQQSLQLPRLANPPPPPPAPLFVAKGLLTALQL